MLNYRHSKTVFLEALEHLASPPIGVPCSWWPRFNLFLGGFRPKELSLLCAPTGAGKTQFLAHLAVQFSVFQKAPIFVAPVETGDKDFVARMLSVLSRQDINNGEAVNPSVLGMIKNNYEKSFEEIPVYISSYDNRVDIDEMIQTLKYMRQKYGVKIALLDNLNFFLEVVSSQQERAEMDNAIHSFLIAARKIDMHVLLIVHPRKTDGGRVESEFDIKGSSLAVQESDNVILFNRPKKEDVESGLRKITDREIVFKKIRLRGAYVNQPIWMGYKDMRLEEYKR